MRGRGARNDRRGGRLVELAIVAMLVAAAYFAIFGGEYSVFELGRVQALGRDSAAELAETQTSIDSLSDVVRRLENDPAAIERVARERYGMIRDGEILYRFREANPDSAAGSRQGE